MMSATKNDDIASWLSCNIAFCNFGVNGFNNIQENNIIFFYTLTSVKAALVANIFLLLTARTVALATMEADMFGNDMSEPQMEQ